MGAPFAAGDEIPEPQRAVEAGRGQRPPVGGNGHAGDGLRVTLERGRELPRSRRPRS